MHSISAMIVRLKNTKKTPISTLKKSKNFKEGKSMQVHFSECSPLINLKIKEKFQDENKKSLHKNPILILLMMLILIYYVGFIKREP
jgi:hypothetical protein